MSRVKQIRWETVMWCVILFLVLDSNRVILNLKTTRVRRKLCKRHLSSDDQSLLSVAHTFAQQSTQGCGCFCSGWNGASPCSRSGPGRQRACDDSCALPMQAVSVISGLQCWVLDFPTLHCYTTCQFEFAWGFFRKVSWFYRKNSRRMHHFSLNMSRSWL